MDRTDKLHELRYKSLYKLYPRMLVGVSLWNTHKTNTGQKNHMEPHGATWSHMEPHGATWNHMEPHGATWSHMEPHGATWSHMEPHGTTWNHMEPS
jgi:hypothetical protein